MTACARIPAVLTAVLATAVLVALPAGPAPAQTGLQGLPVYRPNAFTIATRGEKPSIAVDGEGTAHVAWNEVNQGAAPDVLHFCRVPRGARRCTGEQTFVPPDGDPQFNHEFAHVRVVLPGPDQVMLLTSRYPNTATVDTLGHDNTPACRSDSPPPPIQCYATSTKTWMYRSTDNGATFAPPRIFDHNPPGGDAAVLQSPAPVAGDPGATRLSPVVASATETTTGGTFFTAAPIDGYARDRVNLGDEGQDRAFYGSIAALGDTVPVVAFADLRSTVFVRSHPDPARSLTDIGAWTPSVSLPGDEPRLAGGPAGVYLIYKPRLGLRAGPYTVRRFDGQRLVGPAVRVSDVGADQWRDLFQDDSGRLHAAWVSREEVTSAFDELQYRFSTDGQSFSAAATIARGARNSIYNVELGAADDGGGFAVYSTTFSGDGRIRLAPFGTTAKRTLVDVSIAGLDVTQGIQQRTFAQRSSATTAASVPYAGVTLAALHTTVVRVYATSRRPLAGGAVPPMTLVGFKDGRQLGGGALLPDARPTALPVAAPDAIADADRLSTTSVYTFTLPWQWAQGNVVLRAEINPPGLLPAVAECRLCRADNTFSVTNIPFRTTTRVRFVPAAITVNGVGPDGAPDPAPLFAGARATSPLPFDLPDYRGTIDMSDLANATTVTVEKCFLGIFPCSSSQRAITQSERIGFALARLGDWAPDKSSSVFPIGVFHDGSTLGGATNAGGQLFGGNQPLSIVRDSRPLTSLAHEVGHGLGRAHAGLTCGSNSNGQIGEAWPPADDGALDGIGLDTTQAPPYRVLEGGQPAGPATYFDLMSYCANTNEHATGRNLPDAWVSIRNWERYLTLNAPKVRADAAAATRSSTVRRTAVAAAATPRTLRVRALVPASGEPSILGVTPDAGAGTPVDPAGRYTLVARDAAGKALATAGAIGELQHVENEAPITIVTGLVAAAGATAVDVVQDGAPIAQRLASAHAPAVRVIAPRPNTTVGSGGKVAVRWTATDADPADRLTATVEVSTDGGRSFRTAFIGAGKGATTVPASLLPASRNARVRVRVSDGFRETVATSGRFASLGAPPSVRIITPARGTTATIEAGSALSVRGEAYDDTGRSLSALTWRVGGKVVARGALATIAGLAPGRPTVVLEARDARRRRATASTRVHVRPRPPLFLTLRAPPRLSAKVRKVTLTVAATYTSKLTIGRTRTGVGRTPRRVVVPIRPGSSLLQLVARLTSGSLVSSQVVQIPRR